MKTNKCVIIIMLLMINLNYAQIQTTGLPKEGFEKRITDYVNNIWIIDTHEHLILEEERLQKAETIDFSYLFSSYYSKGDMISAGIPGITRRGFKKTLL